LSCFSFLSAEQENKIDAVSISGKKYLILILLFIYI
jgi:hypothetical protein